MKLEIISPEDILFRGEVNSVLVPGSEGQFEILNSHAPIVSILSKGTVIVKGKQIDIDDRVETRFKLCSNTEAVLEINSGTVEVEKDKVVLLAE